MPDTNTILAHTIIELILYFAFMFFVIRFFVRRHRAKHPKRPKVSPSPEQKAAAKAERQAQAKISKAIGRLDDFMVDSVYQNAFPDINTLNLILDEIFAGQVVGVKNNRRSIDLMIGSRGGAIVQIIQDSIGPAVAIDGAEIRDGEDFVEYIKKYL
ncbi:hypothetical protein [Lactiplantibacillus pentosus]|jgi:predicted lipoprotein|uniref:hypothetical protein n=1 Tax=Lactiplantibacillus pentosus TaxID=1589 RepID=UPI000B543C63|nr:hypothetical protein [Lactiplantibacillus pentosus]ASG78600.1 hypothetical protein CEW82_01435 [Lactiplantibacillus pentosus]MCB5222948.1 hypothetical protein [Lactiplantibacillus pentosus]MCT3291083.1 hypothetical protein [Lactiplantibacillus pentosus]MDO7804389.1 hypothetical protein [Lactiplantibacillus pentosus]